MSDLLEIAGKGKFSLPELEMSLLDDNDGFDSLVTMIASASRILSMNFKRVPDSWQAANAFKLFGD